MRLCFQVNISIADVNDNTPTFPVSSMEFPVKENAPLNSVLYVVHATDKDSASNGKVSYTIQDPSNTFDINQNNGQIILKRALDYEMEKKHILTIRAYDNGSPRKESTMTMTINVQDVNDNKPVFNATVYTVKVVETMPINTRFLHVNATDKDSGNGGRIMFLLQSGPNVDVFGIFPDTGYMYNRQKLDREHEDEYHITVIAMDSGLPPQTSSVQVIITILDENDNNPIFSENTYQFEIEENKVAGSFVGDVSASDPDTSDGLQIKYTFLSTNNNFVINQSGRITTKRALDREAQHSHQFTVKAFDTGIPPRTALVNVQVTVLDENDNKPQFTTASYSAYVQENQPKGTTVIQVSARDFDTGDNQQITYNFATGKFICMLGCNIT